MFYAKQIGYGDFCWYVVDQFGYLASEDMSYGEAHSYADYLNGIEG